MSYMGTKMVLLDYIWPVESIGVGFIIIRPLPDGQKMPLWCTKYCMGIRDDGTTKWFQVHSIWTTFYLQTQKLFIQIADFDYISQDFNWPCTYSALDGGWSSALSAFITAPCAQHIIREYERGKNLVCVLCHYCVQQYTHTDSNFPLLKFSLEMCSNVCRKSRPPRALYVQGQLKSWPM